MRLKLRSKLIAGLFALAAVLALATPVLADIAAPDSPPTVVKFNVYHNLLETNDYLLLIYANIPYATPPSDPVNETLIWRLFDATNTTEYGQTTGYAFNDSGYGYNIFSLYFDNATAPTWDELCTVRLTGNPAKFTSPPTYTFTLALADYTTMTTTEDVQAELAARIVTIATDLNMRWGLSAAYSLLEEGDSGTYLSLYGQTVFRGAIYGLQGLCPALFPYGIGDIILTDRNWETTYADNVSTQWAGTWVADAQAAGAALWETSFDLQSVILVLVLAVLVVMANVMLHSDAWAGLLDVSIVLIATARLGLYGFGFLGLLAAFCVVYIAIKIWGLGR